MAEQGVRLDEHTGIEHVEGWFYGVAAALVLLYFNLFLGVFLSSMHTYLILNNSTTW